MATEAYGSDIENYSGHYEQTDSQLYTQKYPDSDTYTDLHVYTETCGGVEHARPPSVTCRRSNHTLETAGMRVCDEHMEEQTQLRIELHAGKTAERKTERQIERLATSVQVEGTGSVDNLLPQCQSCLVNAATSTG